MTFHSASLGAEAWPAPAAVPQCCRAWSPTTCHVLGWVFSVTLWGCCEEGILSLTPQKTKLGLLERATLQMSDRMGMGFHPSTSLGDTEQPF